MYPRHRAWHEVGLLTPVGSIGGVLVRITAEDGVGGSEARSARR